MRRRPPTATKPMPISGALVIAIAMPPTKANPPTTAIVDRLTLPRKRSSHRCVPVASVCSMHFLGQKRPYDATGHTTRLSRQPSVSQMTVHRPGVII
jgi:hypothetical protein